MSKKIVVHPRSHHRRVSRRRGYSTFPNYALEQILNTGLDRIKSVEQLRDRMRRMSEDDELWERIERIIEADKAQQGNYDSVRKHMEAEYK